MDRNTQTEQTETRDRYTETKPGKTKKETHKTDYKRTRDTKKHTRTGEELLTTDRMHNRHGEGLGVCCPSVLHHILR